MANSCFGVFLLTIGVIARYLKMCQVCTIWIQTDANEEEGALMWLS